MRSLRSVVNWVTLKGERVIDEIYLLKFIMLDFIVRLINKDLFFTIAKKIYRRHGGIYVNCHGITLFCRGKTTDVMHVLPLYEKDLLEYFKIKNGIFIDIGAHIGRYSLIVAKNINEKGHVYSFEPTLQTYKTLVKNLKLNNLSNVTPLQIALSNKKGKAKLYLSNINEGANSLIYRDDKKRFILVETDKLDNVIENEKINPKDIVLVKIDVEGAEPLVLNGSAKLLKYGSTRIICEANDKKVLIKCKKILEQYGYVIKKINKTNYIAEKYLNKVPARRL